MYNVNVASIWVGSSEQRCKDASRRCNWPQLGRDLTSWEKHSRGQNHNRPRVAARTETLYVEFTGGIQPLCVGVIPDSLQEGEVHEDSSRLE